MECSCHNGDIFCARELAAPSFGVLKLMEIRHIQPEKGVADLSCRRLSLHCETNFRFRRTCKWAARQVLGHSQDARKVSGTPTREQSKGGRLQDRDS